MQVFEAKFAGYRQTGCAVILANDEEEAANLLHEQFEEAGLAWQTVESVKISQVDSRNAHCRILFDGAC
jgi:hypothetical protein